MPEISDEEWVEILDGPYGSIIERLTMVQTDLNKFKRDEPNIWVAAKYNGMAHVIEGAIEVLREIPKQFKALDKNHSEEIIDMLYSIYATADERIKARDRRARAEIEADKKEVKQLTESGAEPKPSKGDE